MSETWEPGDWLPGAQETFCSGVFSFMPLDYSGVSFRWTPKPLTDKQMHEWLHPYEDVDAELAP